MSALIAGLAFSTLAAFASSALAGARAEPMRFGIDLESLDRARAKGLDFSFGSFWVGAWTQKYGWTDAERHLAAARTARVTPVINWWYWGDDITPKCVQNGCTDRRQHVRKDRATWYRMTDELSRLIERTMDDQETIVVLEAEFNKGGIEKYEPFDKALVEAIDILHRRGNVKVVLGFGNWGRDQWTRFDRAVEAADLVGTQLLRSSVRDAGSYLNAVDTLVEGARFLQKAFGKPSLIVDLALSSYPSEPYESRQAQVTENLRTRLPELKAAGVRGILYRMIADDPKFDTSNYHGVAERHWGLLRADGSEKPAFASFAATIRSESTALNGGSH